MERRLCCAWSATSGTNAETKRKAAFAIQLIIDAAAPTNFPFGNPAVLKRALESGGQSWPGGPVTSSTT